MSRLLVQKGSKGRIAAIACQCINALGGLFLLIAAISMVIVCIGATTIDTYQRTSALITAVTSIMVAAQMGYMLFALIRSTVTLRHVGIAWIAYAVITVVSKVGGTFAVNTVNGAEVISFDTVSLISNAIIVLLCGTIGAVFLLYESGRLSDKRIVMALSGVAFLFGVASAVVGYIWILDDTGTNIAMWTVTAATLLTSLGSNFVTYGTAFLTGISLNKD